MPSRSEYQPLSQSAGDDDDEYDEETQNVAGPSVPTPVPSSGRLPKRLRRPKTPGHIDLKKLDVAFKRCAMKLTYLAFRLNTGIT